MDDHLPDDFNVIIIGTGLPESVLSGALSRINKSVLQLDVNDYYGSNWASFNIKAFDKLMSGDSESIDHKDIDMQSILSDEEVFLKISPRQCISHGESQCHLSEIVPPEDVSLSSSEDKKGVGNTCHSSTPELPGTSNEGDSGAISSVLDQGDATTTHSLAETSNAELNSTEENSTTWDTNNSHVDQEAESCSSSMDKKDNLDNVAEFTENFDVHSNAQNKQKSVKPKVSPYKEFYEQWRRFNIDLTSKVMFSRGLLVELLIQSNVSRYLEFRSLSRLLTLLSGDDDLQPVPCSRADVFKSKFVSVVQKRILMRVLTMCSNYEKHEQEYEAFKDKTFSEFLQSRKLSERAQHFIIHSIAMVDNDTMTMEGLRATKKFLHSLGRYGNSAFLFPLYGVGELPQAFSRLSAVFGGTFCLRRHAVGVITDQKSGQCKAILDSTGQRINCGHLVLDESNVADAFRQEFTTSLPRAVYVTDRSVAVSSSEEISLITLPSTDSHGPVRVLELSPSCYVCPPKNYLLHAQAKQTNSVYQSPRDIFSSVEKAIFADASSVQPDPSSPSDDDSKGTDDQTAQDSTQTSSPTKPKVLWSTYFNMLSGGVKQADLPQNIHVMKGPDPGLGFDLAIEEARRVFEVICPEEEFLPRAPEPDEIIFNDEGYNTERNENSSESQDENGGEYADNEDDLQEAEEPTEPPGDAAEQVDDTLAQNDDQM